MPLHPESYVSYDDLIECATYEQWTTLHLDGFASDKDGNTCYFERGGTSRYEEIESRHFTAPQAVDLSRLGEIRSLHKLVLRRMHVEVKDIVAFSELGSLDYLDLAKCRVASTGFVNFHNLRVLDLTDCDVDAECTVSLGQLDNLQELSLTCRLLNWEAIRALAMSGQLSKLSLARCGIDDEAVLYLSRHTGLTYLNLSGNSFSARGLAKLSGLESLETLSINDMNLGTQAVRLVGAKFRNLVKLEMSNNSIASIAGIGSLSKLEVLDLSENHGLSDLDELHQLAQLKELSLNNTETGDNDARNIAAITSLTHLDLRGNHFTYEGAEVIAGLSSLTLLALSNNPLGDASMPHISRLTSLKWLELDNAMITDGGIRILYETYKKGRLRSLHHLGLIGNRFASIDRSILNTNNPKRIFDAFISSVNIGEVRIVFVGEGGVGKTWLRQRCFYDELKQPQKSHTQTHDIDVIDGATCNWQPIIDVKGKDITVHSYVWDFAGQSICHGVHQSFLTSYERTVYVLVMSNRRVLNASFEDRAYGNQLELSLIHI